MPPNTTLLDGLYLKHQKPITLKVFRMVGCYHTAEDIAQDAYLRVSREIAERSIKYLQPFLYQVANNLALDHLRKQKVRIGKVIPFTRDRQEEEVVDALPTPEDSALVSEQIKTLEHVLGKLSERRREIFILHKVHHWNFAEIAAYQGISKSAVQKHIKMALTYCISEMQ